MNKFQIGDEVAITFGDATISGLVMGRTHEGNGTPAVCIVAVEADGPSSLVIIAREHSITALPDTPTTDAAHGLMLDRRCA